MQVCLDPRKGLTDENLETIPNEASFFEDWFGVSGSSFAVFAGLVVAGASLVGYGAFKHSDLRRWNRQIMKKLDKDEKSS